MPDTVRVTFLFALGQRVRWACTGARAWRIVGRTYHEGTFTHFTQYALEDDAEGLDQRTAYEPDLLPVEDIPSAPRRERRSL